MLNIRATPASAKLAPGNRTAGVSPALRCATGGTPAVRKEIPNPSAAWGV